MAILPTTNITTTLVRNAIGAATNNVGELVTSNFVNQFGFKSPSEIQNNTFWGKTSAKRLAVGAFPLGLFRGYDHDWVAFAFGGISRISDDFYDPIAIRVTIGVAAAFLLDKPAVTVYHNFTVKFSRTNNFHQGGGVTIASFNAVDKPSPYFDLSFSASTPPDGGAALTENQAFYIQVIHNSSPDKRWFIPGLTAGDAASGGDDYIAQLTVPEDPYTNNIGIQSSASAWDDSAGTGSEYYAVTLKAITDTRGNGYIYGCSAEVADNSSFLNSSTVTGVLSYTSNSTPGTPQVNGSLSFDFSVNQKNRLAAGKTMYYRYATDGGAWSATQSVVVQAGLPPMV